jgi:DNA-binding response OmpR family regulator
MWTGCFPVGEVVRVLLVEDEPLLASAIVRGLRREGMAVDVAHDGSAALEKLSIHDYEVCVLDRDLPGVHGDEVCRSIRGEGLATSVLMLTAAASVRDRVEGLNLGADDYLPKPFDFAELVARMRALQRRSGTPLPAQLTAGDVVLDPATRRVSRGGRDVPLTAKEFAVLAVLMSAAGCVVSAEELLERAWDEHTDPFTNTVRVTVMNLRRKLGEPPLIQTVVGAGYRV